MPPLVLAAALLVPPDTIPEPPLAARLGVGMTVGTGIEVPLTPSDPDSFGGGRSGPAGTNAALRLTIAGHLFHHFTASVTFSRYIVPRLQAPWDPDFIYSIGYDASWPHGFAIGYANYDANRLMPAPGGAITRVDRGVVTAAYAPPLPDWVSSAGGVVDVVHPRLSYDLIPTYYDGATGLYLRGKHRVGVGLYVSGLGGLFANVTAYAYPDGDRQQPWDSDFAYEFGYAAGWPSHLRIHYANYTGTRYPWREPVNETGAFRHGRIAVTFLRRF